MIGIPLGLAVANAGEWLIHKHVLHGLGRERKSFWSFHWHEHHASARRSEMFDEAYTRPLFEPWEPQTKEAAALLGLAAAHLPLFPFAPFYVATIWASELRYYRVHKRSHLDVEWCRQHLPWHFDHHMGKDQDANWCVTDPFFDDLLGTRVRYSYGERVPREIGERQGAAQRVRSAFSGLVLRALGKEPHAIPSPHRHPGQARAA
jgi:Fatty acid hydroxylase superfamily